MTDKILKITNFFVIAGIFFLLSVPFFLPGYLYNEMLLLYKGFIVFLGFIFVMENKILKTEVKIETPIDAHIFLVFIWYIISIFFSNYTFETLNSVIDFFIYILFFYVVYIYSIKFFRNFIFFIIFLGTILSIYGIYQYFYGFDFTLKYLAKINIDYSEAIKEILPSKRIFSTFIYPNTFAGFLILILPVSIGFFKIEKNLRIILFPCVIIITTALLLTKSMGAFLSLIISLFLTLFLISDKTLKNFKIFISLFLLLIIFLFTVILNLWGIDSIFPNLLGKIESYLKMTEVISKHFIKGNGPGSFEMIYNSPEFNVVSYLKYAHNLFFQIFIETGVIGVILFFLILFSGYKTVIENFFFLRTPYKKILIFTLLTGVTAFLIHNMIDFDINNFEIVIIFILFAAIIFAQTNIYMLYIKKLKLNYILGIIPGKRQNLIFIIILIILFFSIITGGHNPIIFSLLILLIVAGFAIWSVSKEDIKNTDIDLPVVFLFLWLVLSLLKTPFINRGIEYFIIIISTFLLFYFSFHFIHKTYYKIFISNFIVFLGIILGMINLSQHFYNFILKKEIMFSSFFPNPNLYASYMLIPFAFLLNKIYIQKRQKFLIGKILLLILFIIFLSFANSKGGILSGFFILIFFYFYYKKFKDFIKDVPQIKELKEKLFKIIFIIFLICTFTPLMPSGKKVISYSKDPFYFNRIEIYKATLKMSFDKFFTGWGIGSFERIFQRYNFPIERPARYQMEANFAHNEFLQIFSETGIIGLILVIIIFFNILKNIPDYKGHKKLWAAQAGAYFAFAGIIFHSFFDFNLHVPGIIFTLAIISTLIIKEKNVIKTVPPEALFFTKVYFFPALILFVILVSIAIRPGISYLLYKKYNETKDFTYLQKASLVEPLNSKYLFETGKIYEATDNKKMAISFFKKALMYDKYNCIYPLHLARISILGGEIKEAEKYFNLSLKFNPLRVFTYAEIGDFYINNLKDFENAKNYYQKAIAIEPYFFTARNNLALIFKNEKNYDFALKEFNFIENFIDTLSPITEYEKQIIFFKKQILYINMANLYEEIKKYDKVCQYLKKFLEIEKDKDIEKKLDKLCQKEKIDECCKK